MSNKFRCYVPLAYNVILNVVKNLSVGANVESPYSLRDVSLRST